MAGLSEFLAMGGHGGFIWSCYALAALVLAGFLVTSLRDLKARERRLRQLEAERPNPRRARRAAAPQ